MSEARPLDLSWEDPLPHALTATRTYLSRPTASTQAAIIALHGRGDNARDFAETFVPHLQSFFGTHLLGEIDENADAKSEDPKGVRVSVRALEAMDGIWFGTHTPKGEADLSFQGPYVHSSLLKLKQEIESLNQIGIPCSRIILVGFSQGAILVNSYLLRALHLISSASPQVRVEMGELTGSPLPLPANFLGWAGTKFSFDTTFPEPSWPTFTSTEKISPSEVGTVLQEGKGDGYVVWSHQQCGSSDRYFSSSDIQDVTHQIAKAGKQAAEGCEGVVKVQASAEMEAGAHSVLAGMIGVLIQMVQRIVGSSSS